MSVEPTCGLDIFDQNLMDAFILSSDLKFLQGETVGVEARPNFQPKLLVQNAKFRERFPSFLIEGGWFPPNLFISLITPLGRYALHTERLAT